MNKHCGLIRARKVRNRRYLTALLCTSLLVDSGCGIPCLRKALPAPALPASYNWNNGIDLADRLAKPQLESVRPVPDAQPAEPSPEADEKGEGEDTSSRKSSRMGGFVKFASFLKPGNRPADNSQSNEQGAPPSGQGMPSSGQATSETVAPLESAPLNQTLQAGTATAPATFENSACLPQNVFYNDPLLFDLIRQALVGNQELRVLNEEIQIARNETYARSGEYRPFLTLGARAGVEKSGEHTRNGAVEEQLEVAPGKDFPDPLPDFMVATNISWELDIWKRLRNAQRAAAMRYLGTQEGRNYIVTRLVADIAENYYELLALDARLVNLERTIEIQEQSLQIAQAKKAAGRGTELAVQRFQAEVQKNQSERSLIAQEIVEAENRINFLVGRYPQPVQRNVLSFLDLNLSTLSAGVPSQLLQNRADIRQAEREVQAAGLDVQVARARFYPNLTLTGGVGWNAFSTGYLFRTPESLIFGAAGELVGPLINKRAIQAAYSSANAAQLQAIYEYQQTILEAHIEVVNQISRVENYARSIENKREQLAALEASVDSASQLFQNARAEYVEVLLAQREMMEARMVLIDVKREQLSAIVNAYQALGGGGFQ